MKFHQNPTVGSGKEVGFINFSQTDDKLIIDNSQSHKLVWPLASKAKSVDTLLKCAIIFRPR